MPPTVITQIHGEFFQQPKYVAGHPYHAKPGMPTRFAAPGIRPTSTNPRGGYFQTPTNMSRFRTVPCKYFLAGTCNFGEACRFLHTTPDGQIVPHQPVVSQQQVGILLQRFGNVSRVKSGPSNDYYLTYLIRTSQ